MNRFISLLLYAPLIRIIIASAAAAALGVAGANRIAAANRVAVAYRVAGTGLSVKIADPNAAVLAGFTIIDGITGAHDVAGAFPLIALDVDLGFFFTTGKKAPKGNQSQKAGSVLHEFTAVFGTSRLQYPGHFIYLGLLFRLLQFL